MSSQGLGVASWSWVFDPGFQVLDAGLWILSLKSRVLDAGLLVLGIRFQVRGPWRWALIHLLIITKYGKRLLQNMTDITKWQNVVTKCDMY